MTDTLKEEWTAAIEEIHRLGKPCRMLGYCPYGPLVEDFGFSESEKSCVVFGHDCPVFSCAEPFVDDGEEIT